MDKILDAYPQFDSVVTAIKAGDDNQAEFLGAGAESTVWRVTSNGIDYVVKVAQELSIRGRQRDTLRATQDKINTNMRGLGIKGLEQICAASLRDRVVVCEYVRGITTDTITASDMDLISDTHVDELLETITHASKAGILFDGWNNMGGNAIFNPEDGFTLIDYQSIDGDVSVRKNISFALKSLGAVGVMLANRIEQ